MAITLCVMLWARPGQDDALVAYEDKVLELVPEHGGRVLQRARSDGADGHPLEIQYLQFPHQDSIDAYLADDRRLGLAGERDAAIERTTMMPVTIQGQLPEWYF